MPSIPLPGDVGKEVGLLFKGTAKSGAFTLDPTVRFSGVTSSGLAISITGVARGSVLDPVLKASYAGKGGYTADVTYDAAGKALLNTSVSSLLGLPGLKLSGSVFLPDANSAKLSVDYAFPYLSTKATVSLTSKPVVDVVASTGYENVIVGVETGFDTAKSAVSKYNVAVGYHAPDFQLALNVLDQLGTVKVGFAQSVSASSKVGAEVTRKLATGATTVNLGYARTLATGALAKVKVDNTGLLTALYESRLASGEKVAGSVQLQATDLSKPIKYGFALDLA